MGILSNGDFVLEDFVLGDFVPNPCILTRNGDLKAELMQLIKRSEMNGQREGSITGLDIMPLKNLVLMSQLTTMLTLTNSTISIQNFI